MAITPDLWFNRPDRLPKKQMDVLTDVLRTVRLQSQVYGRIELTSPWGIQIDCDHPVFYVVSRGNCWLAVDEVASHVPLVGGDFVFLPHGHSHVLRDDLRTSALPIAQVVTGYQWGSGRVLHHGGGGASVSMVFGCFTFESGGSNPLVESLPPLLHVQSQGGLPLQDLGATLYSLATETADAEPGAQTVVNRLADILFVQAIRRYISSNSDCPRGWLQALKEPKMGAVLCLMHERPDLPWTVEALAAHMLMSRSAFAARFKAVVGEPPLGYLTRWRMHKAKCMLLQGNSTLRTIAHAVGYETEGAFGKAFKRYTGTTPGEYRKARFTATDGAQES